MYRKTAVIVTALAGMLALISSCATAPSIAVPEPAQASLRPVTDASEGWQDLFAPDLSNAVYNAGSWAMEEGVLSRQGRGNIWTKEQYGDFTLDLEFKLEENTNSGVFIRTGDIRSYVHTAIEIQIHSTTDGSPCGMGGAVYDCVAPTKMMTKPAGEWNRFIITAKANKIYVVYNGEQVIDMDLDLWTEAHLNPDGSRNKFNTAYKDMPRVGPIGLQDHGQPIWFRNIKIKRLAL